MEPRSSLPPFPFHAAHGRFACESFFLRRLGVPPAITFWPVLLVLGAVVPMQRQARALRTMPAMSKVLELNLQI